MARVSAVVLKEWLVHPGWDILDWDCSSIWAQGVDPVLPRLQVVFGVGPELATLLSERDLGEFISRERLCLNTESPNTNSNLLLNTSAPSLSCSSARASAITPCWRRESRISRQPERA